jgi:hypothetical protein
MGRRSGYELVKQLGSVVDAELGIDLPEVILDGFIAY